jgi:hypothetical protein
MGSRASLDGVGKRKIFRFFRELNRNSSAARPADSHCTETRMIDFKLILSCNSEWFLQGFVQLETWRERYGRVTLAYAYAWQDYLCAYTQDDCQRSEQTQQNEASTNHSWSSEEIYVAYHDVETLTHLERIIIHLSRVHITNQRRLVTVGSDTVNRSIKCSLSPTSNCLFFLRSEPAMTDLLERPCRFVKYKLCSATPCLNQWMDVQYFEYGALPVSTDGHYWESPRFPSNISVQCPGNHASLQWEDGEPQLFAGDNVQIVVQSSDALCFVARNVGKTLKFQNTKHGKTVMWRHAVQCKLLHLMDQASKR